MSIKTDNSQTLVNALAEIDRLKRLVSEYKQRSENLCDALVSHIEWESEQPQMKSWLLRKQAEAVEAQAEDEKARFGFYSAAAERMQSSSQRLRNQADEPENNNAQEH